MVEIANIAGVNAPQVGIRSQAHGKMSFQGANDGNVDTVDISSDKKKSKKWIYWLGGLAAVAATVYGGGRAGWFGEAFQKRMQGLFNKGTQAVEDGIKPKPPKPPEAPETLEAPKTPEVTVKEKSTEVPKNDTTGSSKTDKVVDFKDIKVNGQYVFPQTPEDYIRALDRPIKPRTAQNAGNVGAQTHSTRTTAQQAQTQVENEVRTQAKAHAQREINAFRLGNNDYYIMENGRVIEKPYDSKEFREAIKKYQKQQAKILTEAPNGQTVGRVNITPPKVETNPAGLVEQGTPAPVAQAPKGDLTPEAKLALDNAKKAEAGAKFQGTTSEAIDAALGIGKESANTKYYKTLEQTSVDNGAWRNEHVGVNQYQINDGAKYAEDYARLLDERDAQNVAKAANKPKASPELMQLIEGLRNGLSDVLQILKK